MNEVKKKRRRKRNEIMMEKKNRKKIENMDEVEKEEDIVEDNHAEMR